jgi:hypothetical protein
MLLEQATRAPTITDIAQSVCTDYTTQNYQLLINQIEPGPITGGSSLPNGFNLSGQFDSNAKSQLTSALQSLDRSSGRVISCQQHQLTYHGSAANPSRAQFIFQMHRSGTPKVYSSLMNFTQASGTWLITRDSNFVGTPG